MELATDLLAKSEELKKAREDISILYEAINKSGTEFHLLRSQLDEQRNEKLELCGKVQGLEVRARQCEQVIDELREEVVDLSDHNRKYWQEA